MRNWMLKGVVSLFDMSILEKTLLELKLTLCSLIAQNICLQVKNFNQLACHEYIGHLQARPYLILIAGWIQCCRGLTISSFGYWIELQTKIEHDVCSFILSYYKASPTSANRFFHRRKILLRSLVQAYCSLILRKLQTISCLFRLKFDTKFTQLQSFECQVHLLLYIQQPILLNINFNHFSFALKIINYNIGRFMTQKHITQL